MYNDIERIIMLSFVQLWIYIDSQSKQPTNRAANQLHTYFAFTALLALALFVVLFYVLTIRAQYALYSD